MKSDARSGLGSFELLLFLLTLALVAAIARGAGWLWGVEIGWGIALVIGALAPVALLAGLGVVAGIAEGRRPGTSVDDAPELEPVRSGRSEESPGADPCVRVLEDGEGRRRVRIFRRDTGTWYFQEEYWNEHPLERCWTPVANPTVGFYDSEETALREARGRTDWL